MIGGLFLIKIDSVMDEKKALAPLYSKWDVDTQSYKSIVVDESNIYGSDYKISKGAGYFVRAMENYTIDGL